MARTEEIDYTLKELEEIIPIYKDTTSGPTSAMQLVDTTNDVKLIDDSTDASDMFHEY